jgi:hypothetical protein
MQAAVLFLIRTRCIPVADEIKIVPVNGESRPAIGMLLTAGIGPLAQWGLGVFLVDHGNFPAIGIIKVSNPII